MPAEWFDSKMIEKSFSTKIFFSLHFRGEIRRMKGKTRKIRKNIIEVLNILRKIKIMKRNFCCIVEIVI